MLIFDVASVVPARHERLPDPTTLLPKTTICTRNARSQYR